MDSGYLDPSVEEQPSRWRRVLESLGPHYGQILISCAILLVAFGTVMVFSASFYQHGVDGDVFFYLRRQLLWIPIALLSCLVAYHFDYRILARAYPWIFLITIILLALVFVPGIGLAVDASAQHVYVANPLGGSLDEVDLVTFERGKRHHVGSFPRDLVYDAGRGRVWVGAYADGELVAFRSRDSGLTEVARLKVGRLLRGIGLEPASGRVYAASACGIVEFDPAEIVR